MTSQSVCPTCGGKGWHTAGGNDPMACGRCPAGAAFAGATSAAVDDPAWVLARYEEAREIIADIHALPSALLPSDLREMVEDFWATTFLDRCTTLGPDCACNRGSDV